jgi:hypothetical protein
LSIINRYMEEPEAIGALVRLDRCKQRAADNDAALSAMQEIMTRAGNDQLRGMASYLAVPRLIQKGSTNEALAGCMEINGSVVKSDISKPALFRQWGIYFNILKDEGNAQKTMKQYEKDYGADKNLVFMKILTGQLAPDDAKKMLKKQFEKEELEKSGELVSTKPLQFELKGNYPNPFNPSTVIQYNLPDDGRVTLKIYDDLGREMRTLIADKEKTAGVYSMDWDGKDQNGKRAASGLYFCRISFRGETRTMKMTLMK